MPIFAGIGEDDLLETPTAAAASMPSFVGNRPQVILGQGISIPPMVLPLTHGAQSVVIPQQSSKVCLLTAFKFYCFFVFFCFALHMGG